MNKDSLSSVFFALSDPTRRGILEKLTQGEANVTDLAAPFEMSLPAITKHLRVLEKAGLIFRTKEAQWRPCHLNAQSMRSASDWLGNYRQFWDESIDRLDTYLKELSSPERRKGRGKKEGR